MSGLIFLDIDGVLNDHFSHPNGYCGIKPECVYRLNRIVAETGAKLVISSAWRYMIDEKSMTLLGFKQMMMTYGLAEEVKIRGVTIRDEHRVAIGRGEQIDQFLRVSPLRPHPYVVLDNGSDEPPRGRETMTMSESLALYHADRWVKTASHLGLTDADADRAIAILARQSLDG